MAETCAECGKAALGACGRCGRVVCPDHGVVSNAKVGELVLCDVHSLHNQKDLMHEYQRRINEAEETTRLDEERRELYQTARERNKRMLSTAADEVVNEFLRIMREAGNPGLSLPRVSVASILLMVSAVAVGTLLGSWVVAAMGLERWLGAVVGGAVAILAVAREGSRFITPRCWKVTEGWSQMETSTGWGHGDPEYFAYHLTPRGSWLEGRHGFGGPRSVTPFQPEALVELLGDVLRANGLRWSLE